MKKTILLSIFLFILSSFASAVVIDEGVEIDAGANVTYVVGTGGINITNITFSGNCLVVAGSNTTLDGSHCCTHPNSTLTYTLNSYYTNNVQFELFRNDAVTSYPLMWLEEDNAGASKVVLYLQQDGTAGHMLLVPKATAPATCIEGEVYTDTSGAYCYCYTANTWENLGANGSCV